tara:strand:+ start:785 stop:1402 length:618 start_codon:yes stop_codon:yes gene_type:complete
MEYDIVQAFIDPATAYGLAMAAPKIGKGIHDWLNKAPQQKAAPETTAYLNKLRNISKEGLYGQDVKNEIGADLQQSSNLTRAALHSNATKQGLENSGVLAQHLIKEGGQTTLQAARMAKQIAKMNEQSKLDASAQASAIGREEEARKYQNALARKERRDSVVGNLVGGLSDAYLAHQDFTGGLPGSGTEESEVDDWLDYYKKRFK